MGEKTRRRRGAIPTKSGARERETETERRERERDRTDCFADICDSLKKVGWRDVVFSDDDWHEA